MGLRAGVGGGVTLLLMATLLACDGLGSEPTPAQASGSETPALSGPGGREDVSGRPSVPELPRVEGAYRFVSSPDFLNQDVGDVTRSDAYAGGPNSTNRSYRRSLDHVLDEMSGWGARDFLVAGDLVEGSWGKDSLRTGTFGPTRTTAERKAATRRAAAVYYGAWTRRVRGHDLRVHPAVGDHEVGDNPWRRRRPAAWTDFKQRHQALFKRLFADHLLTDRRGRPRFDDAPRRGPARRTAYAVRLDRNVLLVTIDVFRRTRHDVVPRVDRHQLRWLRTILARARQAEVPWVIVQGHTPIVTPVRHRFSSRLTYRGGTSSPLWRVMRRNGVDAYFCGEVHDQTVSIQDGIAQVAHGSLFYRGEHSYLFGQATADTLLLEDRLFTGHGDDGPTGEDHLWDTVGGQGPRWIDYHEPSRPVGTLVLRRAGDGKNRVTERTGIFGPYRSADE